MIYNGHTHALTDLRKTVRDTALDLGPYKGRVDFLAVTGMSGALVGAPVSLQLGIPLVVVRKEGDSSHDSRPLINGAAAYGDYIFLDDFIESGGTYRRVRVHMEEIGAEYAGAYLYEERILSWDGDGIITYSRHGRHCWHVTVAEFADRQAAAA